VIYSAGAAKYCLSGGQDRTVRLWSPNTGLEIKRYQAHGYEVLSLSCAQDNAKFVSSGGDKTLFYWDVSTGQTIRRIAAHSGKVPAVSLNEDASVVVSGSFDTNVKIWDLKSQNRTPIQSLEDAKDTIQALLVGSSEIVVGSVDGHVRTYDLRRGRMTSDYLGQPVASIVPTKDRQTLLVTTLDSKVRLLDRKTGHVLNTFQGHKNTQYRIRACFDVTEAAVLCGDEEGQLWSWDLVEATTIGPIPPPKAHEKPILWTANHPEDSELLTASGDGTIRVWGT